MVASARASSGLRGPTTRSVGGADAGDAYVAGGGGGVLSRVHALSVRPAATRLTRPHRIARMGALPVSLGRWRTVDARRGRTFTAPAGADNSPQESEIGRQHRAAVSAWVAVGCEGR